jgi:hypothetical protein
LASLKPSCILQSLDKRLNQHFWRRLTGNKPNSLCMVLGIEEDDLGTIIQACKVYIGEFDNVSKINFEMFTGMSNSDNTVFNLKGKKERLSNWGREVTLFSPTNFMQ